MNLASINDKRRVAASTSLVDFGLFAGVRPGSDIAGMAREVIGFKLYMAGTTGDLFVPQLDQVSKELAAVAATGKVLAVHAEDEKLRRREPEKGLEDHMKNRNGDCETSAIRKIREAGKGVRLHICHVSAKESIPLVTRAEGVTSEVTPHHLLLDKDSKTGTFGKVNPPLRKREDRQALFKALKDGVFDIVASDHAPHTIDEKQEDFDYAPAGMPGVETMLPLMLQLVRDKHLSISDLVTRACARPGEIYGVAKGRIEAGYDADLIVVDMTAESAIRAGNLNSKCGWTAYDGMKAIFPKAVFLRGQLMMEDGSQVGERIGRDVIDSAGKP